MTDQEPRFAWGTERTCGCDCPALAAGYTMSDTDVKRVAEMYDSAASHYPRAAVVGERNAEVGLLTTHHARQAWFDTINLIVEKIERGYEYDDLLHAAARIAHDHGWFDD